MQALSNLLTGSLILAIALYILAIIWVVRDARQRDTAWYIWLVVALIPIVGLIAYLALRPPLYEIDKADQEIGLLLKQRQLMHYGECPRCRYPIESNYVVCPSCHAKLKNICKRCGHSLDLSWDICPYCALLQGPRRAVKSHKENHKRGSFSESESKQDKQLENKVEEKQKESFKDIDASEKEAK